MPGRGVPHLTPPVERAATRAEASRPCASWGPRPLEGSRSPAAGDGEPQPPALAGLHQRGRVLGAERGRRREGEALAEGPVDGATVRRLARVAEGTRRGPEALNAAGLSERARGVDVDVAEVRERAREALHGPRPGRQATVKPAPLPRLQRAAGPHARGLAGCARTRPRTAAGSLPSRLASVRTGHGPRDAVALTREVSAPPAQVSEGRVQVSERRSELHGREFARALGCARTGSNV